jgi:TPR repeat protein
MMEQMEDSHGWGWLKFLGELLLLALAILWFIQQPQFEPAIVVLASAGSIVMRVATRRSQRTIFALLAATVVCALTIYGIRRARLPENWKSLFSKKPDPATVSTTKDSPALRLQTGLTRRDYLLVDNGRRLLKNVLKTKTISEIREAANNGDEQAQYLLAVAYNEGEGLVADENMAMHWFRKSAKRGFARSQYAYGEELFWGVGTSPNKADAITWLTAAANQGVAPAAVSLGRIYLRGDKGIPKDVERASSYYEKALDLGYPEAGYWLANLLLERADDSKAHNDLADYARHRKRALEYLRWSAERGITLSQNQLGTIYQYGTYLPKDVASAVEWYRKAAQAESVDAYISLARLLEEGADNLKADPAQASKYWRLASEQGSNLAKVELAERIKDGKIQPAFPSEFISLCESALANGSTIAAYNLAKSYWKGEGVTRDPSLAVRYAVTAIDLGYKADSDSEDAYPLHIVAAAHLLEEAQQAGVAVPSGKGIDQFKIWYGPPQIYTRLTVEVTCGTIPDKVYIYVWNWGRKEAPTEMQFDWYSKARGCEPQPGTRKALRDIYDDAQKNGKSYKELVDQALKVADGTKK